MRKTWWAGFAATLLCLLVAGRAMSQLKTADGAIFTRAGTPNAFSCSLNAIGTTLTQCQAAPASGFSIYVTDVVNQSNTATAGLMTLRYGTGSNCGTGTGNLLFGSASALLTSPPNTAAVAHWHLDTPLKLPAANALCVLGVVTNTTNITINGFAGQP